MRRISMDVVGLAAVSCGAACAAEFEPAAPWYIPADNDDSADQGEDDSDGAAESSAGPSPGEAEDGGGSDPTMDPPPNDDGADTLGDDGAAESSEVGDGPPGSPYEGAWDIGDCQNDIAAATNQPGGTIDDISFTDQFGEQVRLYDFCHKAVLIIEGAFW